MDSLKDPELRSKLADELALDRFMDSVMSLPPLQKQRIKSFAPKEVTEYRRSAVNTGVQNAIQNQPHRHQAR